MAIVPAGFAEFRRFYTLTSYQFSGGEVIDFDDILDGDIAGANAEFSFVFVVKRDVVGTVQTFLSKTGDNEYGYKIGFNVQGQLEVFFFYNVNGTQYIQVTTQEMYNSMEEWLTITVTYEYGVEAEGRILIYVNGIYQDAIVNEVGGGITATIPTTGLSRLQFGHFEGGEFFIGQLNQMAFTNAVMTKNQAATFYGFGAPGDAAQIPSVVSAWNAFENNPFASEIYTVTDNAPTSPYNGTSTGLVAESRIQSSPYSSNSSI